jgi:hypothetical protein
VATDRIQGFIQRSGKTVFEAQQETVKTILEEIDNNFASHPMRDVVGGFFVSVLGCVTSHRFAEYYVG